MQDLVEFCHILADQSPDEPVDLLQSLLESLKEKGRLPSGVETVDELNAIQMQRLLQEQQRHEKEFRRTWAEAIAKSSRFKQANVVNFELAQKAMQKGEQVWVAPIIMRPGKQSLFFHHLYEDR